jgi:hypothetical protein
MKTSKQFVTGSSPEPLIAEASAQIMHPTPMNEKPYLDLWVLLGKFVDDHGFALQSAIEELIGHALSISPMDHAINGLLKFCELRYQTPVTVELQITTRHGRLFVDPHLLTNTVEQRCRKKNFRRRTSGCLFPFLPPWEGK